jgi:hypothetical protein
MKIEPAYFWPAWFYNSLPLPTKTCPPEMILQLQQANLYLWRALNIYDDFLDGEGRPIQLPRANAYYRKFLTTYYRLNLGANFYKTLERLLANLDQANLQEVAAPRLVIKQGRIIIPAHLPQPPRLLTLAEKSLALGLGPLAIINQLNLSNQVEQFDLTLRLFQNLLAAKQLADDSQDWLSDLSHGQITLANLPILQEAKRKKLNLNLTKRPEVIYLLFATIASPLICRQLQQLITESWRLASRIPLTSSNQLLKEILGPIQAGLEEVASFRAKLSKPA